MCIFYKHDSCFFLLLFNFIGPHRRSSGWVSPGHAICNRAERNSSNLSIWNRYVYVQRCLYAHLGRGVPISLVWIVKLFVLCTAWWYFTIVFLLPFFAVTVWTYLCFIYHYIACLCFKIMPLVEFYPNRVSLLVVWPCNFWSCWLDILGSLCVSGKLLIYPSPKPTLTLTSDLGQNVGLGEG